MFATAAEPDETAPTTTAAPVDSRKWPRHTRLPINPLFIAILLGAALLRLWDVNWDGGTHIHPDERFLTMAGNALHLPTSISQYLDPARSPLNPTIMGCDKNGCPYSFFVYGAFPITLNKVVAVVLHNDTYDAFTLQGRVLSALSDLGALLFLYLIAGLLERKRALPPQVKYLGAALYGVAVLPIQLSHFFAVDTFLNVFILSSLYFALRYAVDGDWKDVAASAVLFGCAVASKTSGLALLPLDLYLILSRLLPTAEGDVGRVLTELWRAIRAPRTLPPLLFGALELLLSFGIISYLAVRLADPYYFQNASLLDPRLSQLFLHNIDTLRGYDQPDALFPPGVQWVHKLPVTFALTNLAIFGLGVPLFLLLVAGAYVVWIRFGRSELMVLLLWTVLYFLFQSTQYVKTMRYFIFLYPLLALFAGIGFWAIFSRVTRAVVVVAVIALLVWPAAFMSIYLHPQSRVTASEWMYATLPNNSYIVSESWDDPLPLQVANPSGKTFPGGQMDSFNPDVVTNSAGQSVIDPNKWKKTEALLKRGDYIVLSSNRGWGSIPTVPERYPRMVEFYKDLFAGRRLPGGQRYQEVARFTSFPSLRYLGIPLDFPDQWSEEAFTVYDHPEVDVFERIR